MKILEFIKKITTKQKTNPCENHESHENHKRLYENHKKYENHTIHIDNHELIKS